MPCSTGASVARAASTASSGRSRLPPAPSRWAPTCGMAPIGLSIRSARRTSTARISSSTSAAADEIAPAQLVGAAVFNALIFVIEAAAVTMFLNIQKELKEASKTTTAELPFLRQHIEILHRHVGAKSVVLRLRGRPGGQGRVAHVGVFDREDRPPRHRQRLVDLRQLPGPLLLGGLAVKPAAKSVGGEHALDDEAVHERRRVDQRLGAVGDERRLGEA